MKPHFHIPLQILLALLCMASSACAAPAAVQPCWKLDFAAGRPRMNWWSIDRTNNTCALDYVTNTATGGQSLQFAWNSKGIKYEGTVGI